MGWVTKVYFSDEVWDVVKMQAPEIVQHAALPSPLAR
jgi:hypothetical protein